MSKFITKTGSAFGVTSSATSATRYAAKAAAASIAAKVGAYNWRDRYAFSAVPAPADCYTAVERKCRDLDRAPQEWIIAATAKDADVPAAQAVAAPAPVTPAKTARTLSDHALTAKKIREELKREFPGVKFTVKSESFANGDAVRVNWIDGPLASLIDRLIGKYQCGSFDGYTDCYNYSDVDTALDCPGVKYTSVSRALSDARLAELQADCVRRYGSADAYADNWGDFDARRYEGKHKDTWSQGCTDLAERLDASDAAREEAARQAEIREEKVRAEKAEQSKRLLDTFADPELPRDSSGEIQLQRLCEGQRIRYSGDMANLPGTGKIIQRKEATEYGGVQYRYVFADGRTGWIDWQAFSPSIGRRFELAEPVATKEDAALTPSDELSSAKSVPVSTDHSAPATAYGQMVLPGRPRYEQEIDTAYRVSVLQPCLSTEPEDIAAEEESAHPAGWQEIYAARYPTSEARALEIARLQAETKAADKRTRNGKMTKIYNACCILALNPAPPSTTGAIKQAADAGGGSPESASQSEPAQANISPIDETAARNCKHAMSFSEYREGSATAEYNDLCANADGVAAAQKELVHPQHHEKIDRLLASYKHRLAENINARNRNGASCPSIMIAGPSNFPTRKKERQNAREDTLMKEYVEIKGLLDRIRAVGTGGIQGGDVDAIKRLQEKLDGLREAHAEMIAQNRHWRKHGTMAGYKDMSEEEAQPIDERIKGGYSWERCPAPASALQSSNAEMKRLEGRIEELHRAKEQSPEGWSFDGGHAECDAESMRLRLFFDEKPGDEMRTTLKSNGFKWAPSVGAWQRLLNKNALYAARKLTNYTDSNEAEIIDAAKEIENPVEAFSGYGINLQMEPPQELAESAA